MTNAQVFYRKWRPQLFQDVAGQQHVTSTLRRAVSTGRVAHAYLFTGPRGVGKTSTARILAKALNCLKPHEGEPDNTCANCVAVQQDRMLDLIEIDAASNRGIDDIRKLRDSVAFQPVAGLWKVYIIDEVHMLTEPAFNALLKTLEEPPPRVVLVLATTDSHKVPATVISRCQRYDFRRLSNEDVVDRLAEVCGEEGIECEPEVLQTVARSAWGSLRDAENILEQLAVSYGGLRTRAPSPSMGEGRGEGDTDDQGDTGDESQRPEITLAQARELLGMGGTGPAIELATALLAGDAARALAAVNREAARGADLRSLRSGTVEALRAALLLKAGVEDAISQPGEVVQAMKAAGKSISLERVLQALSALGEAAIKEASSSPLALELAVISAIATPHVAQPIPSAPTPALRPAIPAAGTQRPPVPPVRARAPEPAAPRSYGPARGSDANVERDFPTPPSGRQAQSPAAQKWAMVTNALRREKFRRYMLGPLLKAAQPGEPENGRLVLRFQHKSMRENVDQELQDPRAVEALEKAVADAYGAPLKVVVAPVEGNGSPGAQGQATASESPLVRAALAMGARVVSEEEAGPDE